LYDEKMVLPPVFQIARLNWVRYRAARKTLKHLADAASRRAFMRHARRSMSLTRLAKPTDKRVKALDGQTIYCRSGLADLGVVYDTFEGRYHLPPAGIGAVRTILDLGANIGLTMAHFAVLYPQARILGVELAGARILGVELDAANCELCRKNIAPYGERCQVLNAAVWHMPGEVSYAGVRESGYAIATGLEQRAKATAPAITVDAFSAPRRWTSSRWISRGPRRKSWAMRTPGSAACAPSKWRCIRRKHRRCTRSVCASRTWSGTAWPVRWTRAITPASSAAGGEQPPHDPESFPGSPAGFSCVRSRNFPLRPAASDTLASP